MWIDGYTAFFTRCSYVFSKAINHSYEEYVLNVGDFDERIFLGDDASVEIGTPAKSDPSVSGEISERTYMQRVDRLKEHFEEVTFEQNFIRMSG